MTRLWGRESKCSIYLAVKAGHGFIYLAPVSHKQYTGRSNEPVLNSTGSSIWGYFVCSNFKQSSFLNSVSLWCLLLAMLPLHPDTLDSGIDLNNIICSSYRISKPSPSQNLTSSIAVVEVHVCQDQNTKNAAHIAKTN